MDQNALVAGGEAGLIQIARAFLAEGFPVKAIYLIKRQSMDGYVDWTINLVLSPFKVGADRDALYALARLRRRDALPDIDERVRLNAVRPDSLEASRILDYAKRSGKSSLTIRNAVLDGLSVEYAIVAQLNSNSAAAA